MELQQKYEKLKEYLKELGSVAVAYSNGVDSTLLLKVAHDVLGENAMAITAASGSLPLREKEEAIAFCKKEGIVQVICETKEIEREDYVQNPVNRCYICKNELFSTLKKTAEEHGMKYIAEGSNVDDLGDYRPGLVAVKEQGAKSPLRYAGLTKDEIRTLSKQLGLPTWEKQAFACLASRFPYGERISNEGLGMVEKAEEVLMEEGLRQFRVRCHGGNLARIETDDEGFEKITTPESRKKIYKAFKEIGFTYISIDLQGYRMGSMNETLAKDGEKS